MSTPPIPRPMVEAAARSRLVAGIWEEQPEWYRQAMLNAAREDLAAALGVCEVREQWGAHLWYDGDVDNDTWISWAEAVWDDIRETNTLNAAAGREDADERHICPLQLDLIERCIRLWSNLGETVLSPFGGIGSEPYVAVKLGRAAVACELKPSYWRAAVANLRRIDAEMAAPTLFGLDTSGATP